MAAKRAVTTKRDGAATREKLVQVSARVFNRDGYGGTDSNRLARAAGYAPGTFYKHFEDKLEAFIAAHRLVLAQEWFNIEEALADGGTPAEMAARVVDVVVAHHRKWRTFRASMRVLVFTTPKMRKAFRAARDAQLDEMEKLRVRYGAPPRSRDEDAVLLFVLERLSDALAEEEAQALGVAALKLRDFMVEQLTTHLTPTA